MIGNRLTEGYGNGQDQRHLDFVLPNDPDAERAVLGSMLLSTEAIEAAGEIVTASDFYDERHQTVFALAQELDREGQAVDAVIVAHRLPPKLAPPDGWGLYLGRILEAPEQTAHVRHYAGIVSDLAKRRRLLKRCRVVQESLKDTSQSWEDIQSLWTGEDEPADFFPLEKTGELGIFEPFPVDCLPSALQEFTNRAALSAGCDPAFIALPILSALAGCVGISRALRIKEEWIVPAVVWTCTIGESGTGKSPAMKLALRPLNAIQNRWFAEFAEALDRHAQEKPQFDADFAEWKRTGRRSGELPPDPPAEPTARRLLVDDTTTEALPMRLVENPKGLLVQRDELSGWFQSFNQYRSGNGGDVAKWLSLFDAESITVDRKTSVPVTHISRAAVSITGGIQPEILKTALGREHFQNGLAARFLMAMPPRTPRRWIDTEVGEQAQDQLADVYRGLLDLEPEQDDMGMPRPKLVGMTPKALSEWKVFMDRHGEEQADLSGALASAWSKLESYAARLALLVHLVDLVTLNAESESVGLESVRAGIRLAGWFGRETRRIYSAFHVPGGANEELTEIRDLEGLIRSKGGAITPRELQRSRSRYKTSEQAEKALNRLKKAGRGKWQMVPTNRRPRREFRLFDFDDWRTPVLKGTE